MGEKLELKIVEAELTRINLESDETLFVKITAPNIRNMGLEHLKRLFEDHFPNNSVVVLGVEPGQSVELSAVKEIGLDCGPKTCEDCNCGKGESNGS